MQPSDYEIADLDKQELDELMKLENAFKEKTGKSIILIAWEPETANSGSSGNRDL